MFPITVTIHNNQQLNAVLAAMGSELPKVTAAEVREYRDENQTTMKDAKEAVQKGKAETKKSNKVEQIHSPEKNEGQSSAPTPTVSDSSKNSSTGAPAENIDAKPVTYQDAATAVTTLSRAKGRDAAVAVLKEFGAEKLPDVKPEQFADVIMACEEALA